MAPTDTYNTLMSRFKKPNKQSQTYRESQQQVIPRVAPTLTAADIEKEKTGSNGEVVKLADQKPAQTTQPTKPTQPTQPTQPQQAQQPEQPTQPTMPDLSKSSGMQSALQGPGKLKGVEGIDTSPKDLKGWLREVEEYKRRMGMETAEQREKREKKEKAERIIAAIGDGISALSQIHAASNGAVVNQGTGSTLAEGVAKRHERLRRERDTNENRLLGYLRERRNSELAERKAKREEQRAEQAAKHQAAQEKYWDEQAKRWANADEVARQKAAEQERSNKVKEAETERTHKANEAIRDKSRQDQKADRAANRAQKDRQFNQREANKDKRAANSGNKNKPAGGNTGGKKHKQNPYK